MSRLEEFVLSCHKNISSGDLEIETAIDYLTQRGLKYQTINKHKIGYCHTRDTIPDEIAFYGKENRDDDKYGKGFDYFIRGRIIIPIYSEFQNLVGFATRKPSFDKGNTWWNLSSPFKKNNHLFLLDKARKNIFSENKIYIVEGYMDALILMQEGLNNVVAVMGTTLSHRKIGLIARYCNNVCICLDVDQNNAGQIAQQEFVYSLKQFNFCESISVISLPMGVDPDVYVMQNGLKSFLDLEHKLGETEIAKIYKNVSRSK